MIQLAILTLFLPLIGYVLLLCWPARARRLKPNDVGWLMMILGLLTPVLASWLALTAIRAASAPGEVRCATGVGAFLVFGYLITGVGLPALALLRALGNWLARRLSA
jgi:hypothetical protein